MYLLISLVNPLTASGKLLSVKTAPLQTRPDGDQPPSHSQPFYTALISLQTDRIQTRTNQHRPRSENDPILHSVDKPADSQIQDQGSNCLHSIKAADDKSMKKFSVNKITVLYTDTINPCSALSDKTMMMMMSWSLTTHQPFWVISVIKVR